MVYSNNFGQSRVGVRNRVVNVVNSVDADAIAFIAAAGITNLTQAAAINTLVNDLKTYGLWTKMKALYPMVGGTATSHKFNLKDPRDLDAAYRLVFNGGWTHTSTGALPNGTTGWATTYFNPTTQLTTQSSNHLAIYLRTNINEPAVDMGSFAGAVGLGYDIESRYSNVLYSFNGIQNDYVSFANTDSRGLFINTRTSNNVHKILINGVVRGTNTNNFLGFPNTNIALATRYNVSTGLPQTYSSKEQAFASIGDGLSDTEATNFYNSVQKFQTSLGRQIGSPIVSDTDAQAFLNAAAITDLGQANAVNTLVIDLKAAGVWTKMKALYPFVGGTATTHKWNLKDPRDLDAAFILTFSGGWTHSATGALPNGTTGYANTRLAPQYVLASNNSHLSFYSRSNTAGANRASMGSTNSPAFTTSHQMFLRFTDDNFYGIIDSNTAFAQILNTNTTGYYVVSRTANNSLKAYKNSSLVVTNTTTITPILNSYPILIGARNDAFTPENYDNKEAAFASIGDGLSDTEASAFYTAVQKYQTTLGRQIGTPVLPDGQTAGLLETYSGAAAAYSLRKLRNGYVGNAIRVRRSSDNAEQDIAFDASGNLDTTSLLAFVGSGNGFVTTWYDQSGNSRHTVQTTATSQPYIVINGSISLQNGKPTLYFNGSSSWLQCSPFPNPSYQVEPFSLISVMGLSTGYSTSSVYCPYGTYNPNQMWFRINNNKYEIYNATTVLSSSINASSGQKIISNIFSDTDKLRVNGVEVISGNSGTYPQTYYGIGRSWWSGWYYNGYIQEHIVYISDQITNVSVLESNINTYYSIY